MNQPSMEVYALQSFSSAKLFKRKPFQAQTFSSANLFKRKPFQALLPLRKV
jgi:hypothetical protein